MSEEWNANALVGTQVGTCVLERPLGVGGMGAVYLARQSRPRRQVAVKLLRPRTTADPREWSVFLARFRREADATAALDHANIVPIYEFGEDGTLAYLVMPYLPTGSLGALISREGPLSVRRTIAYLEQAASALDCAHRNGIIHRDVKPSNLLLHPDGRLLLADFGIARPLDTADLLTPSERANTADEPQQADAALTQAGVAMGTPEYMAPEQIRGEKIGPATDIYALGMVAYAMLTGHTPFAGTETSRILKRQVSEPPRPLRTFRPDVPPQVERAILWALAKNPAERPPNGSAFAHALRSGGRPADGATGAHRTLAAAYTPASGGMGLAASVTRPTGNHAAQRLAGSAEGLGEDPDATLYDGVVDSGGGYGTTPSGTPVWPGTGPNDAQQRRGRGPLFGCLAAVGLVLAFALLLTNGAGWLEGLTSASSAAPNIITPIAHKATPTPTPSPTPTPTPTPIPVPDNWLAAQPNSLSLTCDNGTQTITLTNLGNKSTDWQAQVQDDSFTGSGIQLNPNNGSLKPHRSVRIAVSNQSKFNGHNGVIELVPDNQRAGDPAAVAYTTQPCFGR